MKNYSKHLLSLILLVNVVLAGYFLANLFFLKDTKNLSLPSSVIAENKIIQDLIADLNKKSSSQQVGLVFLSTNTTLCSQYSIVDLVKEIKVSSPELKFHFLFPSHIEDQELSNFKANLNLDSEVLKMNSDVNSHWENIQNNYNIPAAIIVANQEKIYTSQDTNEIKKIIQNFSN